MVDLSIGEVMLPLRTLLLISSLGLLPIGTILSHMVWQSTLEACTKSLTSLRGGILLGLGYQSRNLRHILPWLLHNRTKCLLLQAKHGVSRSLRLNVGTLDRELRTLALELWTRNLHRGTVREWGLDKLTGLQEAGLGVASRMFTQKTHLALVILLHFL
jgi:hypothetical protein